MYITPNTTSFDWTTFFKEGKKSEDYEIDSLPILKKIRVHLKENNLELGILFTRLFDQLFSGIKIPANPNIIELGAATGFLTRFLVEKLNGTGLLVDRCEQSYKLYQSQNQNKTTKISYLISDIFELNQTNKFDIVCSFGLIEHFEDKTKILDVHRNLISSEGIIIIIIPMDTPLTRCYYEAYPELNLGYRELLRKDELLSILKTNHLSVLQCQASQGYKYDFLTAICKPN